MVIAGSINLNVSCKLHPYSLQRTRLPPVTRLPRRIGNKHPRDYFNLKGKDIYVEELYCELNYHDHPQWGRSWYTLLIRPNKAETAVQCFRMWRVNVCQVMVIQFTTSLLLFYKGSLGIN